MIYTSRTIIIQSKGLELSSLCRNLAAWTFAWQPKPNFKPFSSFQPKIVSQVQLFLHSPWSDLSTPLPQQQRLFAPHLDVATIGAIVRSALTYAHYASLALKLLQLLRTDTHTYSLTHTQAHSRTPTFTHTHLRSLTHTHILTLMQTFAHSNTHLTRTYTQPMNVC